MKNTSENQVNNVYLQCMYHKSEDKLNKWNRVMTLHF